MATILIAYDLNNPGRDYPRITGRIQQIASDWCRPLESTWIIQIAATPVAVRDDLMGYVDSTSKLFVVDMSADATAWSGIAPDASAWLNAKL